MSVVTNFTYKQVLRATDLNSAFAQAAASAELANASDPTKGAALIGFMQDGTGAVATTVQAILKQYLSVIMFGADPTGVADSTTAIQNAINRAKTTGKTVYFPAGTYLVTKSLDCTFASAASIPVNLCGDNRQNTVIRANLTEAYPVLDFTNNKNGSIKNLTVSSLSSSLDTCALLLAETVATGGSLVAVQDCSFTASSTNANTSVMNLTADQCMFSRCGIGASAQAGFTWGNGNPYNIASKFRTIAAFGGDVTYGTFIDCNFLGNGGPAFNFTGGVSSSFTDCYFGMTGAGSGSIFTFANGGYTSFLELRGCRSENQSSATGVAVFTINSTLSGGQINGNLNTDASGAIFAGAGNIQDLLFRSEDGSIPLFNNSGTMTNCTFDYSAGLATIGTNPNAATCYNLTFKNRPSLASVLSLFAGTAGLEIFTSSASSGNPPSSQKWFASMTNVIFPASGSPTNNRLLTAGDAGFITPSAYTGGSGLLQVATYAFNPTVLSKPANVAYFGSPYTEIEICGHINGASGDEIQIQLVQGGTTVTALDATSLPAGTVGFRISLRFIVGSSIGVFADLVCGSGASPYIMSKDSSGTAFTAAGGTININLLVNSSSSTPLGTLQYTVKT